MARLREGAGPEVEDARRSGDWLARSEPAPAQRPRPAPRPGPRRPAASTRPSARPRRRDQQEVWRDGLPQRSQGQTGHRKCGHHAPAGPGRSRPSRQRSSAVKFRPEASLPCARGGTHAGKISFYFLAVLQIAFSVWEEIRVNRFCRCSLFLFLI